MPVWRTLLNILSLAGMRLGGAAIGFVTQVLLTRLLSQHDVGVVLMAMSASSIISLIGTLGYPALALTSTARYVALGRAHLFDAFKAIMMRDTAVVGAITTGLALALAAAAPLSEGLRVAIFFGCLAAPFAALLRMNSALANSHRRFTLSYLPDFLLRPGLLMVFLVALLVVGILPGRGVVLWAFVIIIGCVALGQTVLLGSQGVLPPFVVFRPRLAGPLRNRALALALVFAVSSAFGDLVTLLGGLYLSPDDVAVLGIAIRLAALAGFVTQAAQQLVLPDLTLVMAKSPREAVNKLLLRVNVISLSAILGCLVGAMLFGPLILRIFGATYVAGHIALVLFMLSQAFRAASGLNQHLLSITGFQAKTAISCLFAVSVLGAVTSLLAPRYGVNGVAMAVVAADAAWAMLLAVQAGRYAGYRGDVFGLLKKASF